MRPCGCRRAWTSDHIDPAARTRGLREPPGAIGAARQHAPRVRIAVHGKRVELPSGRRPPRPLRRPSRVTPTPTRRTRPEAVVESRGLTGRSTPHATKPRSPSPSAPYESARREASRASTDPALRRPSNQRTGAWSLQPAVFVRCVLARTELYVSERRPAWRHALATPARRITAARCSFAAAARSAETPPMRAQRRFGWSRCEAAAARLASCAPMRTSHRGCATR
jgi:hypothetical protein